MHIMAQPTFSFRYCAALQWGAQSSQAKSGLYTGLHGTVLAAPSKSRRKNIWWGESSHFPYTRDLRTIVLNIAQPSVYKASTLLSCPPHVLATVGGKDNKTHYCKEVIPSRIGFTGAAQPWANRSTRCRTARRFRPACPYHKFIAARVV